MSAGLKPPTWNRDDLIHWCLFFLNERTQQKLGIHWKRRFLFNAWWFWGTSPTPFQQICSLTEGIINHMSLNWALLEVGIGIALRGNLKFSRCLVAVGETWEAYMSSDQNPSCLLYMQLCSDYDKPWANYSDLNRRVVTLNCGLVRECPLKSPSFRYRNYSNLTRNKSL